MRKMKRHRNLYPFEAAFKGTPNQFAADAYDCVYVIKEAAEKAELTPDMSVSDMSDALKKAMTEIKVDRMNRKINYME